MHNREQHRRKGAERVENQADIVNKRVLIGQSRLSLGRITVSGPSHPQSSSDQSPLNGQVIATKLFHGRHAFVLIHATPR
jgi:hypothetical protein